MRLLCFLQFFAAFRSVIIFTDPYPDLDPVPDLDSVPDLHSVPDLYLSINKQKNFQTPDFNCFMTS